MNDDQILDLIRAALRDVAPNRASEWETVALDKSVEDLSLDSIATMEMVGFLEDKTDATFPDEELAKVNALADLASLIKAGRVGAA